MLLLVTGTLGGGDLPEDGRADGAAQRAITEVLERCDGEEACLIDGTADVVSTFGASSVARATTSLYRESPETRPPCHQYMHLLGAHLTATVGTGDIPTLGDAWTDCGAGLIHGAFENIPLDGGDSQLLGEVVGLCKLTEFSSTLERYHSCIHAVGHAISTEVGGDLARGEVLCSSVGTDPSFALNNPCLAGIYMVDRDTRVARLPVPTDPAGWSALLAHCGKSPQPTTCSTSYAELSTRGDERTALSYLDWCLTTTGDETICTRLLGQGATFEQTRVGGTIDLGVCTRGARDRGIAADGCHAGARNALSARGTAPDALPAALCRLLEEVDEPCPS